jgi:hypothetical protein
MSNTYFEMKDSKGRDIALTAFVGKESSRNMLQITIGPYPWKTVQLNEKEMAELMYQISRRLYGEVSATDW